MLGLALLFFRLVRQLFLFCILGTERHWFGQLFGDNEPSVGLIHKCCRYHFDVVLLYYIGTVVIADPLDQAKGGEAVKSRLEVLLDFEYDEDPPRWIRKERAKEFDCVVVRVFQFHRNVEDAEMAS